MSTLVLFVLFTLTFLLNAQPCIYSNGLDLSEISGLPIQCLDVDNQPYILTPCQSNQVCTPFDIDRYMVIQSAQDNLCRAGVAQYDESVQPESTTIDGKQAFQFNYQNGEGMVHL